MGENTSGHLGTKIKLFVMNNIVYVILVLVGIVMIIIGLIQYLTPKEQDFEFISSSATDIKGSSDSQKELTIDIEGAVSSPGVYRLDENARVQDAIDMAGGLSITADKDLISKNYNLAQKLADGDKIYIPSKEESNVSQTPNKQVETTSNSLIVASNAENTVLGLININSATSEQLDTLPKVGPVTAQKIISGRPYTSIDDLVTKKILGQKTYDGLKDKITAE